MMEIEGMLEDLMAEEEIPEGHKIAAVALNIKPLMYDQKDMIMLLFDDISATHEHLTRAASTMSSLCKVLDLNQLLVMKSSVRPLIQMSASPGLFDYLKRKSYQMTRERGCMI